MKEGFPGSVILAPSHLLAHGGSQQVTSVWTNPARSDEHRFVSVFILAITPDPAVRKTVETDLSAVAVARGLKANRSIDVYPGPLLGEAGPTREEMWTKIQALGCDAIFTVSLLNMKSEQRYVPVANPYVPYPKNSFYRSFGDYVEHVEPEVTTPGYYVTDKIYFLEGNVFDATTGQIQWSMQSIAFNPSDLECFSKEYALLLVDQLNRPKGLEY